MRKLLLVFVSLCLAVAAATSAALSDWVFRTEERNQTNADAQVDDIKENYAYGRDVSASVTYTMYLFPSTIYLDYYSDFLQDSAKTKPEDLFGYIEPEMENGVLQYDADGNVKFKSSAGSGDDGYLNLIKGSPYTGYYLGSNYESIYETAYNKSQWKANGIDYGYGDHALDTNPEYQIGYGNSNRYPRNLHRYDRFGAWPLISKDDGRWLPIKINVDENFSNALYTAVVQHPRADMGDPKDWYIYMFAYWAYVAISGTSYTLPYFMTSTTLSVKATSAIRSFYPTDSVQRFDLTQTFSKYADANGVIRLFPKFTNGKGYGTSYMEDGGCDVFRMKPEYNASADKLALSDLYMTYTSDRSTLSNNGYNINIGLAMYSELNIDICNSILFQMDESPNNPGKWVGAWRNIFTDKSHSVSISDAQINQIKETFGGGLYNVYLFVANICGPTNSDWAYDSNLLTQFSGVVEDATSKISRYPSLIGKNLIDLSSIASVTDANLFSNFENGVLSYGRQVYLYLEKVRDGRVVTNVGAPTATVNDDGTTSYTVSDTLEKSIQDKYNSTPATFQLISENLYVRQAGNSSATVSAGTMTRVQSHNYCYILRDVDFTQPGMSEYFQIRFQERYRYMLKFAVSSANTDSSASSDADTDSGSDTDGSSDTDNNSEVDIIYGDPKRQDGTPEEDQIFAAASLYFEIIEADAGAAYGNQTFFKLKDDSMFGVYDFIMIFEKDETEGGAGGTFYVYAYRHKNTFLKIFNQDVPDGEAESGATFAQHTNLGDGYTLLFRKQYYLGEYILGGDENEENKKTLETCLKEFIDGSSEYTYSNFILRDHVTGVVVAWFDAGQNLQLAPFRIRKNYILYAAKK